MSANIEPSAGAVNAERQHSATIVAHGAAWTIVDVWAQQGIGLVAFLIIGNIVGPGIFGLMAIGLLFQTLAAAVLRETFGEALIQATVIDESHIGAAFWAQIAFGTALCLVSLLAAPFLAQVFGHPEITTVFVVMAFTLPALAISNVLRNLLRRRMDFRALAIRSLLAYGLSALVAVALAMRGWGLWSLLVYQLGIQLFELAILVLLTRWRPRLEFSRTHFEALSSFAYKSMGSHLLGTIGGQVDRLVIGLFLGPVGLGLYGLGRRIMDGIDQTVLGVINTITLPVLAPLKDRKERLCTALIQSVAISNLIIFPVYAGLALVAPRLIDSILKPEWHDIGLIVSLLCGAGFLFPTILIVTVTQRAVGQPGVILGLNAFTTLLRGAGCLAAALAGTGLIGVTVVTTILTYVLMPLRFYLIKRAIGVGPLALLRAMAPAALASAIMAASVISIEKLLAELVPSPLVLAAMISVGVLSYALAVALLAPKDAKSIVSAFVPRKVHAQP